MKHRLVALLILTAITYIDISAQSVVITRTKITYIRPRPISEYKKTFTINYPRVNASTPALSKRIETSIAYSTILQLDLKDEITGSQWLDEADYEIGYNENGILSMALSMNGSAAYPDGTTKHVVVDLDTGKRVMARDVFKNLRRLLALIRTAKRNEVARTVAVIKIDREYDEQNPKDLFDDYSKYNPVRLNDFSVADDGVTFHYDYGFPHVLQALEPDGEFTFTWKQLKPYIRRDGLLARFAR